MFRRLKNWQQSLKNVRWDEKPVKAVPTMDQFQKPDYIGGESR